ncbi:MAG: archease [Candidatus Bathyarchaeota archaeon]
MLLLTYTKRKFSYLEHKSDVYAEAYGSTLEEAFENMALAMFETMTDTNLVRPTTSNEVEAEGIDKESLLYNWLEKLLVKFDTEGLLFSKIKIDEIGQVKKEFKLKAKVHGEIYNPKIHTPKVEIKAVTYHLMEIKEENKKITVKVLFDI